MDRYLVCLTMLDAFAARTALSFTCVDAKVSTQVQSQQRSFPCLYAKIVTPFGFLPLYLEKPGGSNGHKTWDGCRDLLTTSFNSACPASQSALNLHAKLWRPRVLTLSPHLQTCGLHTGAPILRATANVKVLTSTCVLSEGTDLAAANNLALSPWLDSSKSVSSLAFTCEFITSSLLGTGLRCWALGSIT